MRNMLQVNCIFIYQRERFCLVPRLHLFLNGRGIYAAATQPDLISAAQTVDVSPASVSLLLTLVSCYLGWLAVFFWKHNTDFRQMIEEQTSLDFRIKQLISVRVIHHILVTGNIWPLCTSWEFLRIQPFLFFCLPLQWVFAHS